MRSPGSPGSWWSSHRSRSPSTGVKPDRLARLVQGVRRRAGVLPGVVVGAEGVAHRRDELRQLTAAQIDHAADRLGAAEQPGGGTGVTVSERERGVQLGEPGQVAPAGERPVVYLVGELPGLSRVTGDRKSTRLNSSHVRISYAVFCL